MNRKQTGFTLIELLVVVAIIAVLAALAIPVYRNYMLRVNRAECESVMMNAAATLERHYAGKNTYAGLTTSLPNKCGDKTTTYNLTPTLTKTTSKITAAPIGKQTGDSCGSLSVDNQGTKTASGSIDSCWRR
jgi:type IV pilus assembly protein PilE